MPQFGQMTTVDPVTGEMSTAQRTEILNRVRRLNRQRSSLSTGDGEWLDFWQTFAEKEVAFRFASITWPQREPVFQSFGSLNLPTAYDLLSRVQPSIRRHDGPEDVKLDILDLQGQEGVSFDTARKARSQLAYLGEMMGLWEAVWIRLSVAGSKDAAQAEFLTHMVEESRIGAELKQFLAFYDMTMDRCYRTYSKVSRILEADKSGYNLPGGGVTQHPR